MTTKRSGAAENGVPAISRRAGTGATREVRTGVYLLVVLTAGAYLPSPLYAGYQQAFGADDLVMTLTYATFALVSAPALLLFGPASDALGPKAVLRLSLAAAAAGSACFALAAGPAWLIAGRAAQGLALGAATSAAGVLISARERTPGGRRASVAASTAFVAGTAAGPIAGGVLAEYAPAPHTLPFLLHLALLWAGWRLVAALDAPRGARPVRWRPTRPEVPAAMRPVFCAAAATGFLAWTAAGLFLSVIPILLGRAGGADLAVIGGVLGTVLICSVLSQRLVPAVGAPAAQSAGLAAVLASLALLAWSAGGSTAITLLAAIVAGTGHGWAYGGAAAAVEEAVPAEQRGAVTGALHVAFYLGAGLPAIVIGLITLVAPLVAATVWVTAAAAALVPAAGVAVAAARRPRRARAAVVVTLRPRTSSQVRFPGPLRLDAVTPPVECGRPPDRGVQTPTGV
ncbi:MFS transporter [Streptomonospora litoralis]|uniref:Major Facilitator Superfamily protein n=1 Tax=Streptomonospora litoralis TaxID=2498135 RepID=A0A4P6QA52_9ACTN|nr:MFS transporter [Streptomonospora litoralis]QBI56254.1 Major Facilitator Superfamily protein [Streptomonospora litoralis]